MRLTISYRDYTKPGMADEMRVATLSAAMAKLQKYEDAEEQGRLVILPCKVRDVIWWKNGHHILDCHVVEVQISAGRSEVIFKFGPQLDIKAGARFEDFGKTVFLTREEAEAALHGR